MPSDVSRVKIKDYGVVGDCRSAALISRYGSVDWLCWPQFDSPSIFAALLDPEKGGHWSIFPEQSFKTTRSYVGDSNVLETRFVSASGEASLIDLMPVASEEFKRQHLLPTHELIRELRCIRGEMPLVIEFYPRASYGKFSPHIQQLGVRELHIDVGRGAYWLRSNVSWRLTNDRAIAELKLNQGDTVQFAFSYAEESPAAFSVLGKPISASIRRSLEWWHSWASKSRYQGRYREAVARSALTLKLLAYAPSGAVVAAPTTSLPERLGDGLNWDYRYCWIRDASLTIRSLIGLGYFEEAGSFISWLLHTTRLTQPELHILYTVWGETAPCEKELGYLSGYFSSQPVRTGNAARRQLQLDIYGEVIEAAAQYAEHLRGLDRTTQKVLIGFGKYVANHWNEPDEGIWEPRSGRANNTYSRLMCWVVLDCLLSLNSKGFVAGIPREVFARERERIRQQIEKRAWNETFRSYVGTVDGDTLDAALLRIPWHGFEAADSERMRCTFKRLRAELAAGDDLIFRYQREPSEGAFGICGFWVVEYLALAGRIEEAHSTFERLLDYANDLGLFSEEIAPESGEALGNFPQAFTHIGLISAALTIQERERGELHPAERIGSEVRVAGRKRNEFG